MMLLRRASVATLGLALLLAAGAEPRAGLLAEGEKGNIKVTAVDKSGAAVANLEVQVQGSNRVIIGGDGRSAGRPELRNLAQVLKIVAKATTDKDGAVEFKGIAVGKYRLYAKDATAGMARLLVEVKAGKTTDAKLELAPQ